MAKIELHTPAPDFELQDFLGRPVRLSRFRHTQHVIMVFNRGFV